MKNSQSLNVLSSHDCDVLSSTRHLSKSSTCCKPCWELTCYMSHHLQSQTQAGTEMNRNVMICHKVSSHTRQSVLPSLKYRHIKKYTYFGHNLLVHTLNYCTAASLYIVAMHLLSNVAITLCSPHSTPHWLELPHLHAITQLIVEFHMSMINCNASPLKNITLHYVDQQKFLRLTLMRPTYIGTEVLTNFALNEETAKWQNR